MRIFLDTADLLKSVYQYEKKAGVDIRAVQIVLTILADMLLLLDIRNFKLGKYAIGMVVMMVIAVGAAAVLLLRHHQKNVYRIFFLAVGMFLFFALPISVTGANDGFALLWYMLMPIVTLILFGIPYGAPMCIGFGVFVTVLFWTPLCRHLLYEYAEDYQFYYPVFYWGFCLIVAVMDIFYKLYQMRQIENEKNLEAEVQNAVEMTKSLMVASVTTISRMLDEKDSYTQEHSKRVAEYAELIARRLDGVTFTEHEISLIYRSALMHDIGKIAIPDAVLNKPARLTDEEYEIMKTHTIWGRRILAGMEFLPQADLGAEYHHERFDGRGYPHGLRGEEIPLMARIISAADALDAMNSNRCYRGQCEKDYIIGEFKKGAGIQFDALIAETVVKLIEEEKIII